MDGWSGGNGNNTTLSVLLLSIQDTGTSGVKKKTYFDIGH